MTSSTSRLATALRTCGLALSAVFLVASCGGGYSGTSVTPTVEHVHVTRTYSMPSSSMEPTIHCAQPGIGCEAATADDVVVQSFSSSPKRGDILVFNTPPAAAVKCGKGGVFIKRLIGLPGEIVSEKNGYVSVDEKPLKETYVQKDRRDNRTGRWSVPMGQYFFMGDNRAQSCDSREWGSVPRMNIIGRVVKIRRVD